MQSRTTSMRSHFDTDVHAAAGRPLTRTTAVAAVEAPSTTPSNRLERHQVSVRPGTSCRAPEFHGPKILYPPVAAILGSEDEDVVFRKRMSD